MAEDELGTLVIGGGPAGLAPLLAASKAGQLGALLQAGLAVLEQRDAIGPGDIGRYVINSDSTADTFLSCVENNPEPLIAAVAHTPEAQAIMRYRGGTAPLRLVGAFMAQVGRALHHTVAAAPRGAVLTGWQAQQTRQHPDGGWITRVHRTGSPATQETRSIRSRNLIIATGGGQPPQRLLTETIAGRRILPHFGDKLVQSGDILTEDGLAVARARLRHLAAPSIVVLGGSTSAISSAQALLGLLDERVESGGTGTVTILHRRPIQLFYPSAEAAYADGYHAFDAAQDVCPVSRFVFRFAGARFDNRELVMRAQGAGGRVPEPRLLLHRLPAGDAPDAGAWRHLEGADLIVAALGYRPRGLTILDTHGQPVPLMAHRDPQAPLVGDQCGVLDRDGQEIPGLFGIGLAAGYRPCKAMGGEPSFRGQSNGLWLWQNDVGAIIVDGLLRRPPAMPQAAPSGRSTEVLTA